MTVETRKAEAVIHAIRANFNRLKSFGDALHVDVDVSAAMRAVMESLARDGEQTVPTIARGKSVTRQHIQVLVNALIEIGLVVARENPADKRSPLVALTRKGNATFERMKAREKSAWLELNRALDGCDLDATLATLQRLSGWLDGQLQQGGQND